MTSSGLVTRVESGKLIIESEGKVRKFVDRVDQVSFSGALGVESKRPVIFVTERAVFRLITGGLELIEIAPGIRLQEDVLDVMGFVPVISDRLKEMPPACFIR